MSTVTPVQAHREIEHFAKNSCMPEPRAVAKLGIGEWIRQGDVMLERIKDRTKTWKESKNRQLAPGTSQGSRHVAEGDLAVYVSAEANPTQRVGDVVRLLGPQIVAKVPFTLSHPEHAHFHMPAGIYQCSFQLDYNRQRAVRD